MSMLTCSPAEASFVPPRADMAPIRTTNTNTLNVLFFICTSLAA